MRPKENLNQQLIIGGTTYIPPFLKVYLEFLSKLIKQTESNVTKET